MTVDPGDRPGTAPSGAELALSILIPTIPGRESVLSRLLHGLGEQLGAERGANQGAEVIVIDGPGGLGDKVADGLAVARGRLSVVVDDDDELASDYLASMPVGDHDFVGYRIQYLRNGTYVRTITHALDGDPTWAGEIRGVTPKCPFSTEVGRRVPFGNDYTADRRWAQAVAPQLRDGAFVDRHLYRYDFWDRSSAFLGGAERDVGIWPYDPSRFRWRSHERGGPVPEVPVASDVRAPAPARGRLRRATSAALRRVRS